MKINSSTKKYFSFTLILLVSSSFLFGYYAKANMGLDAANFFGAIIAMLINALGLLLTTLISVLVWVCSYNNFINSAAVSNGWVIVRDLCNMFFILILLIIAFATILRQENYSVKKLLPKLLILAVLINFSKTICGIFIDFAQVIMLTFVNGFREVAGGNLTDMLGLDKIYKIKAEDVTTNKIDALSVFGGYVLALIYVLISLVVITVMIAVLVMRMVMLWVYIVLSPLAYLLAAFPAGQTYSQQWWKEFSSNVIVGPVLAFFIWLSFVSATGLVTDIKPTGLEPSAAITVAGSRDNLIKFIISIGMLIGGLMVTQQIGGIAGSAAGKGMAAIQKGQGFVSGKVKGAVKGAAKDTAKFATRNALRGVGGVISGAAIKSGRKGGAIDKIGSFLGGWGKDMQKTRDEEKTKKRLKTLEKLGMRGDVGGSMEKLQTLGEDEKIKRATNIAKGAGIVGLGALTGGVPGFVGGAYGIGTMISKKGPFADIMGYFGKGKKVRTAEKKKKTAEEKKNMAEGKRDKIKEEKDGIEKEIIEKEPAVNDAIKLIENKKNREIKEIEKDKKEAIKRFNANPGDKEFKWINNKKDLEEKYEDQKKQSEEKFLFDKEFAYRNAKNPRDFFAAYKKLGNANLEVKAADEEVKKAEGNLATAREKQSGVGKWFEDRSGEMKGPNHWTIEAAKEGTKQNQVVRDQRAALSDPDLDIGAFSKTAFYTQGGPSESNKKLLKLLGDKTSESTKAIKTMVAALNTLATKGGKLSDREKDVIINWKQGVASGLKGGTKVSEELEEALDRINTEKTGGEGGKTKENKTVAQYKDSPGIIATT